jgi:uncharacterized protein YggE
MRRLIVALIAVIGVATPARAQDPAAQPPTPVIVTMGEAIVRRAPDVAYVTLAVESRARSPRDAQRQNADAMTAVQKRLADAGIPKDAIRTLGYDIQQEFDIVENGRRVPRDFVARNSIHVTVDHIERTGEIIDATVQGGATSVSGVGFDLKNREAAEREALRLAVADARARADAAAAGAGRSVDRILRIEEGGHASVPRPMAVMSRAAQAADTPAAPGLLEIRANVTLTVSMK